MASYDKALEVLDAYDEGRRNINYLDLIFPDVAASTELARFVFRPVWNHYTNTLEEHGLGELRSIIRELQNRADELSRERTEAIWYEQYRTALLWLLNQIDLWAPGLSSDVRSVGDLVREIEDVEELPFGIEEEKGFTYLVLTPVAEHFGGPLKDLLVAPPIAEAKDARVQVIRSEQISDVIRRLQIELKRFEIPGMSRQAVVLQCRSKIAGMVVREFIDGGQLFFYTEDSTQPGKVEKRFQRRLGYLIEVVTQRANDGELKPRTHSLPGTLTALFDEIAILESQDIGGKVTSDAMKTFFQRKLPMREVEVPRSPEGWAEVISEHGNDWLSGHDK